MSEVTLPGIGTPGWGSALNEALTGIEAKADQASQAAAEVAEMVADLPLVDALPNGAIGKSLRISGTSIEFGQGPTISAATQLGIALGVTPKNVSQPGSVCPTMANLAYLTDSRWIPGTDTGLILRGSAPFNDLRYYGFPNAVELREVIGALRAEFAIYSAAELVFASDGRLTYSAGWTEGSDSQSSGGVRAFSGTEGDVATLTHTFLDDEDSACFVWTVQAGVNYTIEYRRDGDLMATIEHGNNTQLCKSVGYRFTRLTPGDHVLTATITATAGNAIIDSALIGSTTPPPILNVLPYTLTPAGWAISPEQGSNAVQAGWVPYVKALCAEFPNVTVVKVDGFDPATMLGDLVHPNDVGASFLASVYKAAAATVPESVGLGF